MFNLDFDQIAAWFSHQFFSFLFIEQRDWCSFSFQFASSRNQLISSVNSWMALPLTYWMDWMSKCDVCSFCCFDIVWFKFLFVSKEKKCEDALSNRKWSIHVHWTSISEFVCTSKVKAEMNEHATTAKKDCSKRMRTSLPWLQWQWQRGGGASGTIDWDPFIWRYLWCFHLKIIRGAAHLDFFMPFNVHTFWQRHQLLIVIIISQMHWQFFNVWVVFFSFRFDSFMTMIFHLRIGLLVHTFTAVHRTIVVDKKNSHTRSCTVHSELI